MKLSKCIHLQIEAKIYCRYGEKESKKNREAKKRIKEPPAIWTAVLASTFTCGMFEMSDMTDIEKKKKKEQGEKGKKIVSSFTTGWGERE